MLPLTRTTKFIVRKIKGALHKAKVLTGVSVNYGNNPNAGVYYNINGIKLYVEVYGSGPPLLMLHGNGGNIGAFNHNIAYFAKRYRVIAMDSRAQGRSVDEGEELTFEMMADDCAALLNAMQIPACNILGWSDGGITAIIMALRHPHKVIKFAATGANLTPGPEVFAPGAWQQWKQQYHQRKSKPHVTAKQRNGWKLFCLDFEQPQLPFEALKAISCPALLICGDEELITVEHTSQIAAHIPNGKLWVVPKSGHAPLVEHAELFNKVVDRFFQD